MGILCLGLTSRKHLRHWCLAQRWEAGVYTGKHHLRLGKGPPASYFTSAVTKHRFF